jgi:hypothetical protein
LQAVPIPEVVFNQALILSLQYQGKMKPLYSQVHQANEVEVDRQQTSLCFLAILLLLHVPVRHQALCMHETTPSWIHLVGQLQERFEYSERALGIRMSTKDPRQLWFLTCTAWRRPPTSSVSELTRKQRSRSVPTDPGMATLVLIHSMIGIKRGKFLAFAHFKTRKRVLK